MKKLAVITMSALLTAGVAGAQATGQSGTGGSAGTGTQDTRDTNRTGETNRGASDMQTGAATTPGNQTDTTGQHGAQHTPSSEAAPSSDPFAGIEAGDAESGADRSVMEDPGTTSVQPGATTGTQPGTTGTWEQPQSGTMQQQNQVRQDPYGTAQPQVQPGQSGTAQPQVQPGQPDSADRSMRDRRAHV